MAKRVVAQLVEIGEFVRKNTKDPSLISEAQYLAAKCATEILKLDALTEEVGSKFKRDTDCIPAALS
jgi:hypothetical protein